MLDDVAGGMGGGQADDSFLEVDDDERGFGVEGGDGHDVLLGCDARGSAWDGAFCRFF